MIGERFGEGSCSFLCVRGKKENEGCRAGTCESRPVTQLKIVMKSLAYVMDFSSPELEAGTNRVCRDESVALRIKKSKR